jgi:MOSC domain-containing protein YiiM
MQVTQPRVPCFKLGIKMGDPRFVGAFLNSGRVGFYLRVLEGGEICAGDPISRIARDPRRISIELAMRALTKGPRQKEIIEMVLSVEALSGAWREDLGKRLDSF